MSGDWPGSTTISDAEVMARRSSSLIYRAIARSGRIALRKLQRRFGPTSEVRYFKVVLVRWN
jgi:hypothetical protein